MRSILTLGNVTLRESLRGHIFWGVLISLVIFLVFCVYISSLSLGTVARVIEDSGMLGITLVCLLVTILFGLFSIYQEKERNELYVILHRIPRSAYLLGRFLGTSYIIIIFSLLLGTGIFLLTWVIGQKVAPAIFLAVYMGVLEFSLLAAIGLLFYTLGLSFTLNAFLTLSVFILGHSFTEAIQSFVALGRYGSKFHLVVVETISYLLPNFDMFNFRLAIVHNDPIAPGEIVLASLYWLLYLAAVLFSATIIMNQKDI